MTKLYHHDGRPVFITHPVDVREALQSGQVSMEDPSKRKLLKTKKQRIKGSGGGNRETAKRRGTGVAKSTGKDAVKASFGGRRGGK